MGVLGGACRKMSRPQVCSSGLWTIGDSMGVETVQVESTSRVSSSLASQTEVMSFVNAESAVRFLLSKMVVNEESGRVVGTGSTWLVMRLVEGRGEMTSLVDDDEEVGRAKEGIDAATGTVGGGDAGGILSRCISSVTKTIC